MPAKSQAQRAYLYATKGKAWVEKHGFDNKGKLPKHVKKTKAKKTVKRRSKGK
jgi:N-acetylglutamate synthase-like GNAT family acetyltransferase